MRIRFDQVGLHRWAICFGVNVSYKHTEKKNVFFKERSKRSCKKTVFILKTIVTN